MVPKLRTVMNSSCCYNYREIIHLGVGSPSSVSRVWLGHGSGRVLAGWLTISSGLRGPILQAFFYCLVPEVPLIRGMPTGPKVLLVMPYACGLRPCDRTHLKNLSGGRTDEKYRVLPSLTLWQWDWRPTPFYLCCIILSLIYFVLFKPEFVSFFRTLYWSTTIS